MFAADNVDHNTMAIDGKGTFHGMGMIATITPRRQVRRTILRNRIEDLKICELSEVEIKKYRFVKQTRDSIKFHHLPFPKECDQKVDILWDMSMRFCCIKTPFNWPPRLVPVMRDTPPASEVLLKLVHCRCSGDCTTNRCTCRKHGLDYSRACGSCQSGPCYNVPSCYPRGRDICHATKIKRLSH